MKDSLNRNLLIIDLLAVLLVIIISIFPSSVLRIVLGWPFLFLFPGYTLLAAILPRREAGDGIERVALSFGVSFMVVALAALVLNFTGWGVRLYPLLIVLAVIIVSSSVVAWRRRRALAEPGPPAAGRQRLFRWQGAGLTAKVLTSALAVCILATAGCLVYIMVVPAAGESFTEFYILGRDGQAQDYPVSLRAGEETGVTAVVICHENRPADYYLEIAVDGTRQQIGGAFRLKKGERWQGEAAFSSGTPGKGQQVEFILYKGDTAYRSLHLFVDVGG